MDIEHIVYSLPSTQAFVDAVTDYDNSGVKIVLLPNNLSREMVGRLIRNRIGDMGLSISRLFEPGDLNPVTASAGAMNISWPSQRTLRNVQNLLHCEGLPDVFYVHRVGRTREWTGFIEGWAEEYQVLRNSGNHSVPLLCVIGKLRDFDFSLPVPAPGLSFHWWEGFPSTLEMRLACRIASAQYGDDDIPTAQWREYVLPGLVGSDVQLAEHMWEQVLGSTDQVINGLVDYWESLEHSDVAWSIDDVVESVTEARGAYKIGQEPPENLRGLWASGGLVYTPEYGLEVHPALLAKSNRRATVGHMLWRGQSELILPLVNEVRLKVCQELTTTFGSDWPVRWVPPSNEQEEEEARRFPLGTELRHVNYLLRSLGMRNPRHDLYEKRSLGDLVLQARNLRNEVAHYNPVPLRDFMGLCEERERTGM